MDKIFYLSEHLTFIFITFYIQPITGNFDNKLEAALNGLKEKSPEGSASPSGVGLPSLLGTSWTKYFNLKTFPSIMVSPYKV